MKQSCGEPYGFRTTVAPFPLPGDACAGLAPMTAVQMPVDRIKDPTMPARRLPEGMRR